MEKIYKNDSGIKGWLIVGLVLPAFLVPFCAKEFTIFIILSCILFIVIFAYFLSMPACWDAYLLQDRLRFFNKWLFFWANEWEFPLEEIINVKIKKGHKEGPFIYVVASEGEEKFYSLGIKRTKELAGDLREKGITVYSEFDEINEPA